MTLEDIAHQLEQMARDIDSQLADVPRIKYVQSEPRGDDEASEVRANWRANAELNDEIIRTNQELLARRDNMRAMARSIRAEIVERRTRSEFTYHLKTVFYAAWNELLMRRLAMRREHQVKIERAKSELDGLMKDHGFWPMPSVPPEQSDELKNDGSLCRGCGTVLVNQPDGSRKCLNCGRTDGGVA
jgi:hypothetical protein